MRTYRLLMKINGYKIEPDAKLSDADLAEANLQFVNLTNATFVS